jgi:hypothetical protein
MDAVFFVACWSLASAPFCAANVVPFPSFRTRLCPGDSTFLVVPAITVVSLVVALQQKRWLVVVKSTPIGTLLLVAYHT